MRVIYLHFQEFDAISRTDNTEQAQHPSGRPVLITVLQPSNVGRFCKHDSFYYLKVL